MAFSRFVCKSGSGPQRPPVTTPLETRHNDVKAATIIKLGRNQVKSRVLKSFHP